MSQEEHVSYKIKADVPSCEGYANCVVAAPEYFDLDDDSGLVVVLQEDVVPEKKAYVENAVRSCPVAALRLDTIRDE